MNILFKSSLMICVLVGTYSLPVQAEVIDTVEQSFSVDDNSQFSLENVNGAVLIKS